MPDIHSYTTDTPNGLKVSITLEELGIEFSKDTQKEPWFLEINPNGRIPALTDTFTDGEQIRVFESGSIMQYLVERHDKDCVEIDKFPRVKAWMNRMWERPAFKRGATVAAQDLPKAEVMGKTGKRGLWPTRVREF
ncbi:hypothetical protein PRZ48_010165 [Zasmidium cellare]|uniref:GST N-terminal domain-containing protein n=1 Tax=Zasmidium cellare TaxID=395010 RepID=A0ABR0EDU7_ZASCE|nr:hypothetical protein PRZ48_010165 [Zasmidium cellare]